MIDTNTATSTLGLHPPLPGVGIGTAAPMAISAPALVPTRFLARQPILDLKQKLHGYAMLQWLERGLPEGDCADALQSERTAINDFRLFMPESAAEKGFARCGREALLSGLAELLPSKNAVLQVAANQEIDSELFECCAALRKQGYRFAVEGAVGGSKHPLIDLADYCIVDFQAIEKEVRREIYRTASGSKAKFVARNIEKAGEIEMARREGCQLLQGFFIASSAIAARRTIPTNQVICLRLMAALSEETTEIKQIESLVMMDTSLTYQLLRRVNSVSYSLNTRVTSIRNALVFVGTDEFRKLVSIALADVFASTQSKTLITIALERAKFCEVLAPRLREHGPKLYLLGMLSLIDIILQIPMSQVMESLPIDNDMKAALRGEQSSIGIALELVRNYQAANWEKCDLLQQKLGMPESATATTYMESVHWTAEVLRDPVGAA